MSEIIKSHSDIFTVPEALEEMKNDYIYQGYKCELLGNVLKLYLDDGYVMIYWKDGAFYQDCYSYS